MKKRFFKRITAFVVASLFACGIITAFPEEYLPQIGIIAGAEETATSGQCGDNAFWELTEDGTLTISGTGDIYNLGMTINLWDNTKVIQIIIQNGITNVGSFYAHPKLKSVVLSDPVKIIDDSAFANCSSLSSINIPDSVTSIGYCSFAYCSSLKDVHISKGVSNIDPTAFLRCYNLESISVDEENPYFSSVGGVLYTNDKSKIVKYPSGKNDSSYAILEQCNTIGSNSFHSSKLSSITMPNSIKIIEDGAFDESLSLQEIDLSSNITQIGKSAFSCTAIESIILPDSVTEIGVSAFNGCTALKSITLPNGIKTINSNTFVSCKSLENIVIPDSVTEIGYYAFGQYVSAQVTIPKSVVKIDKSAFGHPPIATICGYLGSYAETYAKENNIPFVALDFSESSDRLYAPNFYNKTFQDVIDMYGNYELIKFKYLDGGDYGLYFPELNYIFGGNIDDLSSKIHIVEVINGGEILKNVTISDKVSNMIANSDSVFSYDNVGISDINGNYNRYISNEKYTIGIGTNEKPLNSSDKPINHVDMVFTGGYVKFNYNNIESDTYNVTWVNDNGKTIYSEKVKIGDHPTYNVDKWGTPISSTGNEFKGWANIPETGNNIVIPVFSSTDTSYTGNGGDITYYAIYGDFVNVKWYNGNTLLEDNYCKENTVPVYGGEIPKCYDYEYGLVREFLGWTTANNSNYSINTSDKLVPVTDDTIYYAVFSEEEPIADDSMNMDIDKIDYIEQHITSASAKEWTRLNQAISIKETVENSTLEVTHGIWKTVAITDKVVNLDYMGIYGEISANDYNLILLDMFNSVEGYETVSSIIKESSYSGLKDWANILKKCLTKVFGDDLKLDKDLNKAFNTFDKEPTYQNMINLIDETSAFCEKNNMDLSEMVVSQSLLEMYELTNDVLSGINLAVSTLKDVIENAETIAAYRTYQNMSQEYLDLLIDLYKEADNISSNSWEVADLKNAIRYQIYYYAYPDEATLKSMVNIIAKNLIQIFSGDIDDIIKDQTINFIQKTFTKDVTASSKYLKGEIGTYLAAVQNGFKYGVKISDKLFDMNNREELYIKIKEYGVLNEILYKVLDTKANKLLSAKTMDEQYLAANYYDKAYKMYFFIESIACKNAGEYEKTFELPDGIKRALQKYIGTDLIYNNIHYRKPIAVK